MTSKLTTPLLFICLLTFTFCTPKQYAASSQSYRITGTVTGVEDGTWIYLRNADRFSNFPLSDSVQVKKERFEFRGRLDDKVLFTILGFKGPVYAADGKTVREIRLTDATMLWLENSEIIIQAEKGKMPHARIEGSLTQQDFRLQGSTPTTAFIRNSPNTSYYGVFALNSYKESWGKEVTAELYQLLSEEKKNTIYGRQIADYLGNGQN